MTRDTLDQTNRSLPRRRFLAAGAAGIMASVAPVKWGTLAASARTPPSPSMSTA